MNQSQQKNLFIYEHHFDLEGIKLRVNQQYEGLTRGAITYKSIQNEQGESELHLNTGQMFKCQEIDGIQHIVKEGEPTEKLATRLKTLNAIPESQQKQSENLELVFSVFDDNHRQYFVGTLTKDDLLKQHRAARIGFVCEHVNQYGKLAFTQNDYFNLRLVDQNYEILMKIEKVVDQKKKIVQNLKVTLSKHIFESEKFIEKESNQFKEAIILKQVDQKIQQKTAQDKSEFQLQTQEVKDQLEIFYDDYKRQSKDVYEEIEYLKAFSTQLQNQITEAKQASVDQIKSIDQQSCTQKKILTDIGKIQARLFNQNSREQPLSQIQRFQSQNLNQIKEEQGHPSIEEEIIQIQKGIEQIKQNQSQLQASLGIMTETNQKQFQSMQKELRTIQAQINTLNQEVEEKYIKKTDQEIENIKSIQNDQQNWTKSFNTKIDSQDEEIAKLKRDFKLLEQQQLEKLPKEKTNYYSETSSTDFHQTQQRTEMMENEFQNYKLNKENKELNQNDYQLEQRIISLEQLFNNYKSQTDDHLKEKITQVQLAEFHPVENHPQLFQSIDTNTNISEFEFQISNAEERIEVGILQDGDVEYLAEPSRAYIIEFPRGLLTRGNQIPFQFLPRPIFKNDKVIMRVEKEQRLFIVSLNGQALPPIRIRANFDPSFVIRSDKDFSEIIASGEDE